jgi:hypothetical protein
MDMIFRIWFPGIVHQEIWYYFRQGQFSLLHIPQTGSGFYAVGAGRSFLWKPGQIASVSLLMSSNNSALLQVPYMP